MEYRRVGRSGLKVSEIAYGSWITFGKQVDLNHGKSLVKKALDLGINYIDTADVYSSGEAENFLGKILPEIPRGRYVLATKAFWPMSDAPTDRGLSRKHVLDSVEASLDRLRLKSVDLFYCHRWDAETPLDETIETIDHLIRLGKIAYWGTSEWTAEQIAKAHVLCATKGWIPPIINQPNYSLLVRNIEKSILPVCAAHGMGTANFSPLAQGILTGKYSNGKIPEGSRGANDEINTFMRDQLSDEDLLKRVDALKPIAESYGLTTSQLSLAWILQNDAISSVIVGATKPEQLEQNAKASGIKLKNEDMTKIGELFPI